MSCSGSGFSPIDADIESYLELDMAKKGNRQNIILECTEARDEGKPPSRYHTTKNRKNTSGRMELKKYNRFLRRHTLHREVKK